MWLWQSYWVDLYHVLLLLGHDNVPSYSWLAMYAPLWLICVRRTLPSYYFPCLLGAFTLMMRLDGLLRLLPSSAPGARPCDPLPCIPSISPLRIAQSDPSRSPPHRLQFRFLAHRECHHQQPTQMHLIR